MKTLLPLSQLRNLNLIRSFLLSSSYLTSPHLTQSTSTKLPLDNLLKRPSSASATSRKPSKGPCQCGCDNCGYHEKCVTPIPLGSEWHALEVYQSVKDINQMKQEHILRKQKQKEQNEYLQLQMNEMKQKKLIEKESDQKYLQFIQEDLQRYQTEGEQNLKKQQAIYEKNRLLWDEQLEAKRREQQERNEELRQSEQQELNLIQEKINLEKLKNLEIKQNKKKKTQERLEETHQKVLQKELEKKLEREENLKYAKEYEEKVLKDEQDRKDSHQRRLNKMEKYTRWVDGITDDGEATNGGAKGRAAEQKEFLEKEEQKLQKYLEETFQRETEKERLKQEKLRQERQLIKDENQRILQRKLNDNQNERESDLQESLKCKENAEANRREMIQRREAELNSQQRYHEILSKQIKQRKNHEEESSMNAIERALNKDDLRTIKCDPGFHSKVYQRLRMRIASANGPR
jgi:hypothetical protein